MGPNSGCHVSIGSWTIDTPHTQVPATPVLLTNNTLPPSREPPAQVPATPTPLTLEQQHITAVKSSLHFFILYLLTTLPETPPSVTTPTVQPSFYNSQAAAAKPALRTSSQTSTSSIITLMALLIQLDLPTHTAPSLTAYHPSCKASTRVTRGPVRSVRNLGPLQGLTHVS